MMSCNRFMTIKPRERAMKWFRLFIRTTATVATTFLSAQAVAQNERELLAPTGRLRVGVYLGSLLSMVHDRATGEAKSSGVPDEEACSTFSERSRRRDCHRVRPHRGGISIAIIAVVNTIGTILNATFSSISSQLK
jgi:hypothetical protein